MRKCPRLDFSRVGMLCLTALGIVAVHSADARADSATPTAPSVYRTINVTGDPSQFDDITNAATNSIDTAAPVDPISLKIVNDSSNLYLQINYATSVNPQQGSGLYLGIDSDNNTSTGYHVFGSPNIGSNAAFENDFPFTQAGDTTAGGVSENQTFNSGGSLISASATANGTPIYAASPYNTATTYQMIALPLDLTETDPSTSASGTFTDSTAWCFQLERRSASKSTPIPVRVMPLCLERRPTRWRPLTRRSQRRSACSR